MCAKQSSKKFTQSGVVEWVGGAIDCNQRPVRLCLQMASAAETSKESLKTEDTSGAFKRQGSIRKVLPSVPGASDPAKLIDRPGGVSGGSEIRSSPQYAPYFLEYSIMPEFNMLESCQIPGVYMIPSAKSPLSWFGVMFVRQGMYQGAVFRFTLHIPENFPDSGCPTLDFQTPVFHPLVCPATGSLDVSRAFPDWNKNSNHIWQVVEFARKTFMKIDTQHPINIEAAQMYENDPEKFAEKVEECVHSSQQHLYDPPPTDDCHYLSFEPYNSAVHDKVKQNMLNLSSPDEDTSVPLGLSWVAPGSIKPFSKPPTSSSPA